MAQKDAKTTDGSERASGYIREVADAAKAGVDKASDYLEGVTDQTVELVTGAMNETQEQGAAFGSRRIDDVWADTSVHKAATGHGAPHRRRRRADARSPCEAGELKAGIDLKIVRSERGGSRVTHFAQGEGPMKPTAVLAVILIIIGVIALAYGGFNFTTKEKVAEVRP